MNVNTDVSCLFTVFTLQTPLAVYYVQTYKYIKCTTWVDLATGGGVMEKAITKACCQDEEEDYERKFKFPCCDMTDDDKGYYVIAGCFVSDDRKSHNGCRAIVETVVYYSTTT